MTAKARAKRPLTVGAPPQSLRVRHLPTGQVTSGVWGRGRSAVKGGPCDWSTMRVSFGQIRVRETGCAAVDPYLDLLRAGGSDTPERLGKIVGLDLTDPGFWAGGLEAVDGVLGEAEGLAAQTG